MHLQRGEQLARPLRDLVEVRVAGVFGKREPALIGVWLGTVANPPGGASPAADVEIEAIVALDRIGGARTVDRPSDRAAARIQTWHELETPVPRDCLTPRPRMRGLYH